MANKNAPAESDAEFEARLKEYNATSLERLPENILLGYGFFGLESAREGAQKNLDKLRADLAGPNPSPLERLVIERIIANRLYLITTEFRFMLLKAKGGMALKLETHFQRMISGAERRFLSAIKSLVSSAGYLAQRRYRSTS